MKLSSRYYDPETDGYYFEMPSVDGWKKRQPHCSSSAVMPPLTNCSSSRLMMNPSALSAPPAITDSMDVPRTSYGAVLARGQLPPCTITATNVTSNTKNVSVLFFICMQKNVKIVT